MASSDEAPVDELDPAWKEIRDYAVRLLDAEMALARPHVAVPDTAESLSSATVRELIRTQPDNDFCALGKSMSMSSRSRLTVQNGYFRCRGAKCPHCVGYWIREVVLHRVFAGWGYEPVLYRSVFQTDAEWTKGRRAQRLKDAYKDVYLAVRVSYDGAREVFTPGKTEDCEPVADAVAGIVDALLRSPAFEHRKHRFSTGLPKLPKRETDFQIFELPQGIRPEDANSVCEGKVGRKLNWEYKSNARGGSYARRWRVVLESEQEYDLVQDALEPLKQRAEQERAERLRLRKEQSTKREEAEQWAREMWAQWKRNEEQGAAVVPM